MSQVAQSLELNKVDGQVDDVLDKIQDPTAPAPMPERTQDLNSRLKAVEKLMAEDADKAAYAVVQVGQLHDLFQSLKDDVTTLSVRLKEERQERLSGLQDLAKLAEMAVKTTSCIVDGSGRSDGGTVTPGGSSTGPPSEDRDQLWEEVSSRIRSVLAEMRDDLGRELHRRLLRELSTEIGRKTNSFQMQTQTLMTHFESAMGDLANRIWSMEGKVGDFSRNFPSGGSLSLRSANLEANAMALDSTTGSASVASPALREAQALAAQARAEHSAFSQPTESEADSVSQSQEDPQQFISQARIIREKLSRISQEQRDCGMPMDEDSKILMEEAEEQISQIPLINQSVKTEMHNLALSVNKILTYKDHQKPHAGSRFDRARSPSSPSKAQSVGPGGTASEANKTSLRRRSPREMRKDPADTPQLQPGSKPPPASLTVPRPANYASSAASNVSSLRESTISQSQRANPSLPRYGLGGTAPLGGSMVAGAPQNQSKPKATSPVARQPSVQSGQRETQLGQHNSATIRQASPVAAAAAGGSTSLPGAQNPRLAQAPAQALGASPAAEPRMLSAGLPPGGQPNVTRQRMA